MRGLLRVIGQIFGRWTIVGEAESAKGWHKRWRCVCECGTERVVLQTHLRSGSTNSCGCYSREVLSSRRKTHGKTKTPEFTTWQRIQDRCYNPANERYKHYGGRGITVCDRWLESFENFYEDMGDRPKGKYSIDRVDNNGNYEPSNCRWATPKQQMNNTTRTNKECVACQG